MQKLKRPSKKQFWKLLCPILVSQGLVLSAAAQVHSGDEVDILKTALQPMIVKTPPSPDQKKQALDLYNKAKDEIKELEDLSALRDVDRALNLDPFFVRAYIAKGECLSSLNQQPEAKKAYVNGFRASLSTANSLQYLVVESLGRLSPYYEHENRLSELLTMWDKAVLKSQQPESYFFRGECEKKMHLYGKAIADFNHATGTNSLRISASTQIAECYMSNQQYDKAANILSDAIEYIKTHGNAFLDHKNYFLYKQREQCFRKLQKVKLADSDKRTFDEYNKEILDLMPFRSTQP